MPSLQQLLGKEDKFFGLLQASIEEGRRSVQALRHFVQGAQTADGLHDLVAARRRNKAIAAEISEELCVNIVTALEREDIEALSATLYKIPKNSEKIAERILLAPQHLVGVDLTQQVEMLERAVAALAAMMQDVRKGLPWQQIKHHNDQLQTIEGDADKIVLEVLRGIYADEHNAGRVVFLKDLFELFEKSTDRCRDAGLILNRMVLKNA